MTYRLNPIETEEQLEAVMSRPTSAVVPAMEEMTGDLLILGAGGKMGPTLAKLAKRAIDESGASKKVIAVSRFSAPDLQADLNQAGIKTIPCDLLNDTELHRLPDVPNVIFMAGRKFGATGNEALTWAMNTYLPGRIAEKYRDSRIVVFSTGNVYPLTPVVHGGATETHPVAPIGEYAQSCLGRERVFEYFSNQFGTPVVILRLNYAIDLRYGILLDIAEKVYDGLPIDLTMGNVNVIWQGDANAAVLGAFTYCQSPPLILNLTGPETVSIRRLATAFGEIFGKEPIFEGEESETALLSNASHCHQHFGYPRISLEQMVQWVAHWVKIGAATLGKPTKFEVRDGKF
ncbi:MAG: NAD(P)-dependent oxidoreductase [Candidatus Poribacteria bacterium]|nr:NAD(P)-dependent oxidoreductase [Candidatus Poribacteria bacterium]